jgi:hypothetical protein
MQIEHNLMDINFAKLYYAEDYFAQCLLTASENRKRTLQSIYLNKTTFKIFYLMKKKNSCIVVFKSISLFSKRSLNVRKFIENVGILNRAAEIN